MPIKRSRSHRFAFDGREQVAASERQLTSQLSAAIVRRAEVARLRSLNDIGDEHDYNEHDTGNEQPVKWSGVGSLNDLAARITDLLVRGRREFWSINFNLRRSGTSDADGALIPYPRAPRRCIVVIVIVQRDTKDIFISGVQRGLEYRFTSRYLRDRSGRFL